MSVRSLNATVETIKAILKAQNCGAVLMITDTMTPGAGPTVIDVQIASNLCRADQRKLAQHLINLIDGKPCVEELP